jgi:hypothetical protein
LYPEESEILAEAHFKLSLALEFASITRTKEDEDAEDSDAAKESQIDEAMREEAATELEAAIASTKLKLHNKEVELAESLNPEDNEEIVKQIAEAREVIADMEQRVCTLTLRACHVSWLTNREPSLLICALHLLMSTPLSAAQRALLTALIPWAASWVLLSANHPLKLRSASRKPRRMRKIFLALCDERPSLPPKSRLMANARRKTLRRMKQLSQRRRRLRMPWMLKALRVIPILPS